MPRTRLDFQTLLQRTVDDVAGPGVIKVYFNPPEGFVLKHPCIVYGRSTPNVTYADNQIYLERPSYDVTYITDDPEDTPVDSAIRRIPYCRPGRPFPSGILYNYPYTIYY